MDARADIYALGGLLYTLLTGAVPFPASSEAEALAAHLHEPPPRPSQLVRGIPRALDAVVGRAMAKDPRQRYPSAGDLGTCRGCRRTRRPAAGRPGQRRAGRCGAECRRPGRGARAAHGWRPPASCSASSRAVAALAVAAVAAFSLIGSGGNGASDAPRTRRVRSAASRSLSRSARPASPSTATSSGRCRHRAGRSHAWTRARARRSPSRTRSISAGRGIRRSARPAGRCGWRRRQAPSAASTAWRTPRPGRIPFTWRSGARARSSSAGRPCTRRAIRAPSSAPRPSCASTRGPVAS